MKIEHHIRKAENMNKTLEKLDYEEDYETIIEDLVLISSHLINAAMHEKNTLRRDRDIKHNKLFGVLKREEKLGEESLEIANLMQRLEEMRPSQVYGSGENGDSAEKAMKIADKIQNFCYEIVEDHEKEL